MVVILIVLVVNSTSSSCGSRKILTWTGKYESGAIAGARVGKCNLGTRAGKLIFLVRSGKSKLGARAGKYKLRSRASKCRLGVRAGSQAKGQGPGNTKNPKELLKLNNKINTCLIWLNIILYYSLICQIYQ